MKVEIETITPARAARILKKQGEVNRRIIPKHVKELTAEMLNDWVLNGKSIVLTNKGNCLDGQHRLEACRASGVSFETVVCYANGEETEEIMATIDVGKKRTAANTVEILGHRENSIVVGSSLGFIAKYKRRIFTVGVPNHIIAKLCHEYVEEIQDWFKIVGTLAQVRNFPCSWFPGALCLVREFHGKDTADRVADMALTAFKMPGDESSFSLTYERAVQDSFKGNAWGVAERVFFLVTAVNDSISGKKRVKVQRPKGLGHKAMISTRIIGDPDSDD